MYLEKADYIIETGEIDDRLHVLSQKHLREVAMTIAKKIISDLWITDLDLWYNINTSPEFC